MIGLCLESFPLSSEEMTGDPLSSDWSCPGLVDRAQQHPSPSEG